MCIYIYVQIHTYISDTSVYFYSYRCIRYIHAHMYCIHI